MLIALLLAFAPNALAAESAVNPGDTAWILTATALVLFMTIPGLSFFYGGLVASRNVLSVLMHCFVITCLMTVLWLICGYTLAFSSVGMEEGSRGVHAFVGGLDKLFLNGVDTDSVSGTIPELLFFAFQMTFFIITPGLIVGAFVERVKFSGMLLFMILWALLVYAPVCHMVWGGAGGFLADMGVYDFAGGIVVHITAGLAALVFCIYLGPRTGHPNIQRLPHSLPLTVLGTGMLWVGWFGFNAGSALAANGDAAMALVVTQISAATAALTWMTTEWIKHGKPSVLGCVTGAIAGLAAVTPASGFIGPVGGLIIGAVSGFVCWYCSTAVKAKFRYDDSLDVFGVHGVGGIIGTLLVAVFASESFGGKEGAISIGKQFGVQAFAALFTVIYTVALTWIILVIVKKTVGLRVTVEDEKEGLDITSHGEAGYNG